MLLFSFLFYRLLHDEKRSGCANRSFVPLFYCDFMIRLFRRSYFSLIDFSFVLFGRNGKGNKELCDKEFLTIWDITHIIITEENLCLLSVVFMESLLLCTLETRNIIHPHVHAITQDFDAPFLIESGEIMEGEFPPKAKSLVKEFVLKYQNELKEMWDTEKYVKLPPLN